MKDLTDDPVGWGRKLIETNDHDPLYTALWRYGQEPGLDRGRIARFCVAYWCCYNVGASWWMSKHEGSAFWSWLTTASKNVQGPASFCIADQERWPRAHERRHWRGEKAVQSVLWLREQFPKPEDAVTSLFKATTLEEVQAQVGRWPQFGPWIGFKIADMLERVYRQPIVFPRAVVTLYKDPKEGAEMMATHLTKGLKNAFGEYHNPFTPDTLVDHLLTQYSNIIAPPSGGRSVNIQEIETVLCKWKSARKGHYRLGMDTVDHRASLVEWKGHDLLELYPTPPASDPS